MKTLAPIRLWASRRYTGSPIIDLREAARRRKPILQAGRRSPGLGVPEHRDGSGDDGTGPRSDRWSRRLAIAAGVLGLAGIIGTWMWIATADGRALRALPPAQRAQLLHNALENLRNVCDPFAPRDLRSFCREQAEVAAAFRECTGDCLTIARRHLVEPSR
jgi:hypothetical protein